MSFSQPVWTFGQLKSIAWAISRRLLTGAATLGRYGASFWSRHSEPVFDGTQVSSSGQVLTGTRPSCTPG